MLRLRRGTPPRRERCPEHRCARTCASRRRNPRPLGRGGCQLSIATTIIALARGLGLTVVAEGVETEGQRELLEQEGCAQGQGWLFAHAMPPAEFEAWWQVWAPSPGPQDHCDAAAAAGAAPNQLA